MVKELVRFEFYRKLRSLVEQNLEFEKAILGLGEYSLAAKVKHLEAPQCTWIQMSKQQKKGRVQKPSSIKAYTNLVTSTNVSQQEKSDDSSGSIHLSVAWEDSGIQHLSSYRLAQMWKEAEMLLNTAAAVLPAAGMPDTGRQVLNTTGTNPFTVTKKHQTKLPGICLECQSSLY